MDKLQEFIKKVKSIGWAIIEQDEDRVLFQVNCSLDTLESLIDEFESLADIEE